MLCRHVIDICSEVRNDYWNGMCGQNVDFLSVKSDGTLGNHWVLKGLLRNLSTRHVWANVKALELISHSSQKEWSFRNRKTSEGEESRHTIRTLCGLPRCALTHVARSEWVRRGEFNRDQGHRRQSVKVISFPAVSPVQQAAEYLVSCSV
jgi:hypothetical protein